MSLESDILTLIRPDLDEDSFNQGALELFRYQARANLTYFNYLQGCGVKASNVTHWTEVPALPTAAFRQHRVASFPSCKTQRIFQTSGTTEENTGKHEFSTLELYHQALLVGFIDGLPDVSRHHWISLIPAEEDRPTASLSFMVSTLVKHYAKGEVDYLCDGSYEFDPAQVLKMLISCALSETPLFILGTSFAYTRLFEFLIESQTSTVLPPDSLLFDTGGYKGRSKEYTKKQFLDLIDKCLGVKPKQIWNEYGMTELSSQAYRRSDIEPHTFPAWTRVIVRDPATGKISNQGEPGVVQIMDLANVGSVLAISTLDLGIKRGPHDLELMGRVESEALRGCSLSYE